MNDDMPWVDLTPEEIQELRTNKQQLTEYGKQKIRERMNDGKLRFYDKGKETFAVEDLYWGKCQTPETQLHIKEMTHEEMLEVAAQREAENKALEALDNLMEENQEGMIQLAEIEKEEWERQQRSNRILERYNQFYNTEVSGLTWGTPITPEFQQAIALECMLDALRCENLNHEFSEVSTDDINALIEGLYKQGKDYLQRVEEFKDSADGVA